MSTAEEKVLFLILSDDEDGARELLRGFLPGELDGLATAANALLDLIEEVRKSKAEARAWREEYNQRERLAIRGESKTSPSDT
jgi:hypothetical protein